MTLATFSDPPPPDPRRRRNAEALARARRKLDQLERIAAVAGSVELNETEAGLSVFIAGRGPKPPSGPRLPRL